MDVLRRIDDPKVYKISQSGTLRLSAKAGIWCGLILPFAMVLSCIRYQSETSTSYILASICSTVTCVFVYLNLFNENLSTIYTSAIVLALCECILLLKNDVIFIFVTICLLIVANMKSYKLFCYLLNQFPNCFSIGEAILVVQGIIVFPFATFSHCFFQDTAPSIIFSQILILGICLFLIGVNLIQKFQNLLPFLVFLTTVIGILTFPFMFWAMNENPLLWFLLKFILLQKRIVLIVCWLACTALAIAIAWKYGTGSSIKLTVLRKYFHGVMIVVYVPGIFFDVELLYVASVLVLAAFLLLECVRLYNLDYIGEILNKNLAGFLDEKDQGILILTHIYLLVGCSLPIWIFPLSAPANARDSLLLYSGIVSLGIGDTAASVGGTLWGKTKYSGSSKSAEGTLCAILAQICFMFAMLYSGFCGDSSHFSWLTVIIASSVAASLVEAFTSQVDNLVLPLVMYIVVIIL